MLRHSPRHPAKRKVDDDKDNPPKAPKRRERGRYRKSQMRHERRLQSLARVLEGESDCVAIALVKGQLLISANNLTKRSRENNKTIRSIKKAMDYFKGLYHGKDNQALRSDIILALFRAQCTALSKGRITISRELIAKVVDLHLKQNPLESKTFKTLGKNQGAIGFAFGQFQRFYSDFCKIEQSAQDELSDIFAADYHILRTSESRGIHAEVQLLAMIIENEWHNVPEKTTIELGISKLCCLHCQETLDTANAVFAEKELPLSIDFPDRHDLDFTWEPPLLLSEGYESKSKQSDDLLDSASTGDAKRDDDIAFQIGQRAKERIQWLLTQSRPSGVSQHPTDSTSDHEPTVEELFNIHKKSLVTKLAALQELPIRDFPSVKENIAMLKLGLELGTTEQYKKLFDESILEDVNPNIVLDQLCQQLNASNSIIDEKDMLSLLTASEFVGHKIASLFKKLSQQKKTLFNLRSQALYYP